MKQEASKGAVLTPRKGAKLRLTETALDFSVTLPIFIVRDLHA